MYRSMEAPDDSPRRRGPTGAMSDAQMIEVIEQVESCHIGDSPFHGEGHRKVEARLAHTRVFAHRESGSQRLMRENNGVLAKSCREPICVALRSHDGTIIPVDEMWGTDMTRTTSGTGRAWLPSSWLATIARPDA